MRQSTDRNSPSRSFVASSAKKLVAVSRRNIRSSGFLVSILTDLSSCGFNRRYKGVSITINIGMATILYTLHDTFDPLSCLEGQKCHEAVSTSVGMGVGVGAGRWQHKLHKYGSAARGSRAGQGNEWLESTGGCISRSSALDRLVTPAPINVCSGNVCS